MRLLPASMTACALVSLPFAASAQVRPMSIEATPYAGGWEGDETFDSGATFGARAKFNFNRVLGLEAVYGIVSSEDIDAGDSKSIHQFGFDAVIHLSDAALIPYLAAGVGFVNVDETTFATNIGFGATYYITDLIGVRADLRNWFSSEAQADASENYVHFEATLGVVFQFEGNFDIDDDGILNRVDECPTRAEDKDGFRDDDGCPDLDNDEDGVPDAQDKCPAQAEDADDDRDDDGCPDIDDDGDGIENAADKCPAVPEDKDNFDDADGCPDKDNDNDGIEDAQDACPDAAESKNGIDDADGCPEIDEDGDGLFDAQDKCAKEKEARNGFEDGDGCPDAVPEDLQSVLGIQPAIAFRRGRADFSPSTKSRLDAIAELLKKYPSTTVVIGATAHKSADDSALSTDRANAVRNALVERGVSQVHLRATGLGARALPTGAPAGAKDDHVELTLDVVEMPAVPAPANP